MTRKTAFDNIAGRFIIGMAHMGTTRIYRKTASVPATATPGTPAAQGQWR